MPEPVMMFDLEIAFSDPSALVIRAAASIPPGVTVLFGPSGSGKTTLLAALAGLIRPRRGRLTVARQVWSDVATATFLPPHRRRLAYVFQSPALFPHLTAVGNVAFALDRSLSRREREAQAMALLTRMRVGHLAERRPRTFSGGEAQRVALARAFARQPQVVLLDEAFSALDEDLRRDLLDQVVNEARMAGLPVIYVTHDRNEAADVAEQVIVMREGAIVACGGTELLRRTTP